MRKILVVGRDGGAHLGSTFVRACGGPTDDSVAVMVDVAVADSKSKLWSRISYRVLNNAYPRARRLNDRLSRLCREVKPDLVLSTGCFPISARTLDECRDHGAATAIFLSDDPWNPALHDPRFLSTLAHYDAVFSPRRANIEQLQSLGCEAVHYLPFGYDAGLFHPDTLGDEELDRHQSDVMFAGGADSDRLPYMSALIDEGISLGLYGGYWDRFRETRLVTRGIADITTLRAAILSSKVALCLVRRANRDGHVMRTFEVPAVGACMLVEHTQEHEEIFGEDGRHVVYFRTIPEMVERCRWLLHRPTEIARLRESSHRLVVEGQNSYRDRLVKIIQLMSRR